MEFSGLRAHCDSEEMSQEEMGPRTPQILCHSLRCSSKRRNADIDLVERMTDHVLLVGHRYAVTWFHRLQTFDQSLEPVGKSPSMFGFEAWLVDEDPR